MTTFNHRCRLIARRVVRHLPIAVATLLCLGVNHVVSAQTRQLRDLEFSNTTTGKKVRASKPSGMTQEQEIIFPGTAGTVGQVLNIASVSGGSMTLGWQSVAVGTASLSDRRTASETVAWNGTATGVSVPVLANKVYRIEGIILANREDAGAGSADSLRFTITGPASTARVSISVRCYDCTSPTNIPTNATAASTTKSTAPIIPNSTTTDLTSKTYGIEGMITTGASGGSVTIIADDIGGSSTNGVVMGADSYIVLTEID